MIRTRQLCVLLVMSLFLLGTILCAKSVAAVALADDSVAQDGISAEALRRWQSLSPEKQQALRDNYQVFKQMIPEDQDVLKQRLMKFKQLSPEEQAHIQGHYQQWKSYSPDTRQKLREAFERFQALPADEQKALRGELEELRGLSPEDRWIKHQDIRRRYFDRRNAPGAGSHSGGRHR